MLVRLVCVAGARPNFMKIAPLIEALRQDAAFAVRLVHTGQHYDENMSSRFFGELGLPEPDYHLAVGSGSHARQTAAVMERLEPVLEQEQPDGVVVAGDVNSTLAAALTAKKMGFTVIHLEAGLRSFDRTMPEEINRIVTDAISDVLLVSEESGVRNLLREGVPEERIELVGNIMIDSLRKHLDQALQSDIRVRLGIGDGAFGLVTLHRPANVDDEDRRSEILAALAEISSEVPLYWPVHPRSRARLEAQRTPLPESIHLCEPLGYLDFLCLEATCKVVLTDSGGIQEETTALGVPCLTLRENTERPVTVGCGTNRLAGTSKESILSAWEQTKANPKRGELPPLWDGHAAERCVEALRRFFAKPQGKARDV
ncbi:MAG: UDP-N-acetylglucosamine 2-epimerase (non-hydrolyzing) [Bryobacteraceae bacterium]|nr:UDP-N-acetylglucosamine 2-epimerase (non-hydrolyzing) [Bryobacteraceae bacterium]